MAGGPAPDGHLQGVVGCEQGGLQGQVGHGAGAVPAVDPTLNGLPLIGVAVWVKRQSLKVRYKIKVQAGKIRNIFQTYSPIIVLRYKVLNPGCC